MKEKRKKYDGRGRTYPKYLMPLTTAQYVAEFCRNNHHIPATYRIGNQLVTA